ncbi:MAG: hypothetical protein A3C30_01705 [Candidatus Levybacteria bacterium RIFCSPHIGHO2_02_FULL_40_18]|nr:MAG: hypothetical protein A2869_01270 [Candidatus Levybacteria bacterium RIFCSPHIGHO2_01_FULL_40_58]OGH26708.1 MAG: hypothetical protein A3C30_01705 [Candidatus Levybacteria bacterium RIFCSPHIGHO2_02_FULL_40_18]OGH31643.1 MAG: hypothetical protein A3E43_01425 [Candidatus Levybacteria bacterium RIFCSPHIGHO2_12_FULL_40_31]OGH40271.1 MAG: hypothetical protein A2894_02440 [Candidatus Levybacteria bacterium RIFCSPLOWO2_01_FULL_40_64]OGH48719.1 MAG: hypothetical protein A3I54_03600 [Candidatus Lev
MELIFQTSLIASFVAGMVALFAPCCITFLLPAYLGSVFKEKEKILLMTLIFGLGIAVTLLPAVLGVAIISKLLFRYHNIIYIIGGLVLVAVSLITFLGIKSPFMVSLGGRTQGRTDPLSIFILGIFSGITSACCAPVLVGILAFALISPSFWGSIVVGAMYVLGMVTPLLIISLFLSNKVDKLMLLKKPVIGFSLFRKRYDVILSNFIAAAIFLVTGIATLILTVTGNLSMQKTQDFSTMIMNTGGFVNKYVGANIFLNLLFLIVIAFLIFKIVRRAENGRKD